MNRLAMLSPIVLAQISLCIRLATVAHPALSHSDGVEITTA